MAESAKIQKLRLTAKQIGCKIFKLRKKESYLLIDAKGAATLPMTSDEVEKELNFRRDNKCS